AMDAGRLEYEKDEFLAMSRGEQLLAAHKAAQRMMAAVGPYDPLSAIVERQSVHPDDWYLWTAAGYNEAAKAWSVWTMNLSLGGLQGGVYGITRMADCNAAIARKKNALKEARGPSRAAIEKTEQVLADNGIDPDEAQTVLQAIGYTLLDQELYPEKEE
ncbi:MAG: hypothetical protein NC311_12410, partial [Muribaculaceae bacterium]|nr:hypothetical protein [Muribaculaceae bacterium]